MEELFLEVSEEVLHHLVGLPNIVIPPQIFHRSCDPPVAPLPAPSFVATDLDPQPTSNNAISASRYSFDNELPGNKNCPP